MSSSNRQCLFCLKEVESDLKCSRCRTARYCNKECQKKHWGVHKNLCIDSNSEDSNEKLEKKAFNHYEQGSYPKAEKLYRKLLSNLTKKDENHPYALHIMNNLADTYNKRDKYAEAEAIYKQCLDKRRSVIGDLATTSCYLSIAS